MAMYAVKVSQDTLGRKYTTRVDTAQELLDDNVPYNRLFIIHSDIINEWIQSGDYAILNNPQDNIIGLLVHHGRPADFWGLVTCFGGESSETIHKWLEKEGV